MASVENRIVRMEFDNSSFEKKIAGTMKSLSALNTSISNTGSKSGLGALSDSVKGFNLNGMSSAIEGVSKKFLALSTIGITVLSNLTSKAVDAGLKLAKSLSLDQVISGFQEYETNMKSIQTILANTKADGTNLEQVNGALDELNTYADQTIYNFAEMARNIGTFTAAGVDLDTSTISIKGIANAAAISGSTSQQASTAMYQLSQAIASGSLKLMDWNSVVNAGMGGEVMQKALFDTGKAMGTLTDVPLDQTFDQWKDAGNTFRESLQEGWITTDVLTTALAGFSGEVTAAELAAKGFTEEMIAEFQELGETGIEAATKVRTFTQLMDTAQEAVGSGWSQTFRIVLGDFEEATELFTGISEAFGSWADASADARNSLLQDWKDLGGRADVIAGLKDTFGALGDVMRSIKFAFQTVFPPLTAKRLAEITEGFAKFAANLKEGIRPYLGTIQIAFEALFSVLKIGGTIVKETFGFFKDLFAELTSGADGREIANFIADIAEKVISLKEALVDNGGIADFFDSLLNVIKNPKEAIDNLKESFLGFVESLTNGNPLENLELPPAAVNAIDRFTERFEDLQGVIQRVKDFWGPFSDALGEIGEILGDAWDKIREWFSTLGSRIAEAVTPADFDGATDALSVGLLGVIAGMLAKVVKNGFKFDIGDGLLDNITDSFEELTGVMRAMQTDLKANALLKIAGAIGILAASVLVLSLIDSASLSKALAAMAVGFGQLLGAFAILTKLSVGPQSAASFGIIAGGMILLSAAMLLLAFAVRTMAGLDWDELAKGLLGVTVLLTGLTIAVNFMSKSSAKLILVGAALIGIALAIAILAGAMKIFATMSWEEMAKGMVGVAGGLLLLALAVNFMPATLPLIGAGLVLVATSIAILAGAMLIFATMSWEDMAKGMVGLGGGLLLIAAAMNLMPVTMPLIGAGLLLVATSMGILAGAMILFATMSWEEIARGLVGMAGALAVLAIGMYAMSGSIGGALATTIVAGSLMILVEVVKEFANLKLSELGMGLLGIAAVLAVLGVAGLLLTPVVPVLFALGVAMTLLGAGFALFGVGANLTAKAFAILAKAGEKGISVLIQVMDAVIDKIPDFLSSFAEGIIELAHTLLDAAPSLIAALGEVISQLIETLITLIPQFAEAFGTFISESLTLIREKFPEIVQTGLDILMALVSGIRDNINEIVTAALELVTEFLTAIADNIGDVLSAGVEIITSIVKGIGSAAEDIVTAGADAIISFLEGMASNAIKVVEAGFDIVIDFLNGLADSIRANRGELAAAGINLLDAIFGGILEKAVEVANWFGEFPGAILGWIGNVLTTLTQKGRDLIGGLLTGVTNKAIEVATWFVGLGARVFGWIGNVLGSLIQKGRDLIAGLLSGITTKAIEVADWLLGLPGRVAGWAGDLLGALYSKGVDVLQGLWNGISSMIPTIMGRIEQAARDLLGPFDFVLDIGGPSKTFMRYGEGIGTGLVMGLNSTRELVEHESEEMASSTMSGIAGLTSQVASELSNISDITPTIRPVLDLTNVREEASKIPGLIGDDKAISGSEFIRANESALKAMAIAQTTANIDSGLDESTVDGAKGASQVTFEQTINSPKQLSTSDIYRQTRNQITMAKEELEIP